MRRLLTILSVCFALIGCEKDICDDCLGGSVTLYPNMDIGDMRALYDGSPVEVNREVIIAGVVTANDLSGNFYRSFIIEDATGAIEIRAGLYDLKNLFPEGRYVAVKADGLWVSDYNGVLQIGMKPSGGYHQADYFENRVVMDRYVVRGDMKGRLEPITTTVDRLSDDMCGRLVRIEDLTLMPGEPETWASADEVTSYSSRIFLDGDGTEFVVSTSKYASFAGSAIPSGILSLTGILICDTRYALRLRTLEDVVEN